VIPLYPLRFKPIFKEKIWGGRKLHDILGKECGDIDQCGESWELSTVEGNVSVVADGPLKGKRLDQLINEYRSALVGKRIYSHYKDSFPLLIKFLDANEDLSIQVHPDDKLAFERHGQKGKTEMWYIIDADRGASLITGFNRTVNEEIFRELLAHGRLADILNREEAESGDVFFIPAGRIHTIGKGILLAEIQQTSDVTYRVHDFDRTDPAGNKRELHIEDAVGALDYTFYKNYKTSYEPYKNKDNVVVESPYFTTSKLDLDKAFTISSDRQTFRILIFLSGEGELSWKEGKLNMKRGDVYLVPASLNDITIIPIDRTEALLVHA
jgi:mannose-6-phosphate isomerase